MALQLFQLLGNLEAEATKEAVSSAIELDFLGGRKGLGDVSARSPRFIIIGPFRGFRISFLESFLIHESAGFQSRGRP